MLLAKRLLDKFLGKLDQAIKDEIYDTAMFNVDESMAKLAILYEEIYKDYPTGFMVDLMLQHLKDKIFQQTKKREIA